MASEDYQRLMERDCEVFFVDEKTPDIKMSVNNLLRDLYYKCGVYKRQIEILAGAIDKLQPKPEEVKEETMEEIQ